MDPQERPSPAHRRPVDLQFGRSIHGGARQTPAELGSADQARATVRRRFLRVPGVDAPIHQHPVRVEGDGSDGRDSRRS